MSETTYRAGIIAAGGIAREHARGYREVEGIELVACADIDPAHAHEFAEAFAIPSVYTDYRTMLEQEALDFVSVCSWHPQHAEMTIAAAARKPKAILCEKPMATSLGEAEDMRMVCRRNGVKLAIGHQRRFLPSWARARELVAEGAVGEVVRVFSSTTEGLLNCLSHGLDAMRYVLGDPAPVWVMAQVERHTDRYERAIPCEDRLMGLVEFENGTQGFFESDLRAPWQWCYIQGTEGMIDFDDGSVRLFNAQTGGWQEQPVTPLNPWAEQARALIDWVEGREEHRGQADNGYQVMQIMMGAYESARCHERVALPLETRANPLQLMIESGHLPPTRPGRYDIRAMLLRGENLTMPGLDLVD